MNLIDVAEQIKEKQYFVKIINPAKKSEYEVQRLRIDFTVDSVAGLKEALHKYFPNHFPSVPQQVGFIAPGHGTKGKQKWLATDEDISEMNLEHETKKDVYFWAYKTIPLPEVTRKRHNSECGPSKSKHASLTKSKSESLEEKLDEVEDCVMKLKEKHGANYSSKQLRTWAHLIQMQRHESFDTPPDKPFFLQGKK